MAKKKSSPSRSVGVSIMGGSKADMRKWEVESAMSTLKRAEEIRKNSGLMRDVKKMAQEQVKMLGGIVAPNKKK